jgi:hypothetical protein
MSGKQTAVLWLGILLIAVQFYFGGQWKALFGNIGKSTATNNGAASTPTTTNISTGQVAGSNPVIANVAGRGK